MAASNETVSMALFCDFENVALGVRDAKYDKFDIKLVLERLLLKGSIVVKKAYCDWDRYKSFKGAMHEANFELIEIPHVRQSGKNSADIRLVVDALDLCYTKSHVNTFVIISGDSDFSPLVSKLRENAKQVIGVGVQQSTSDLLIANCDEFFFYDDLVRESQRAVAKRESSRPQKAAQPTAKPSPDEEKSRSKEDLEKRRTKAVEIAVQTFDALASERGDSGKIWASVLKNAIKRRKPDFNETYYGFRAFGNLLEEAHARGLLEFGRDEKSGAYVYRSTGPHLPSENAGEAVDTADVPEQVDEPQLVEAVTTETTGKQDSRRRGRGNRKGGRTHEGAVEGAVEGAIEGAPEAAQDVAKRPVQAGRAENEYSATAHRNADTEPDHRQAHLSAKRSSESESPQAPAGAELLTDLPQAHAVQPDNALAQADIAASAEVHNAENTPRGRRKPREPRKPAAKNTKRTKAGESADIVETALPVAEPSAIEQEAPAPKKKAGRKTAPPRNRRPRKTAVSNDAE
ncbi:NYN domain-containing protein [Paraburkholderia sp. MPAMCS5]|uniref:NYN domain-containing protein n=1 Tax=Paraburkholderia sp. MPAMCS5 TaxID=3112563 RepID=UPI002E17464E|nr:NYN domain-containing protein [Paraburkholderia sp. MPAMCS5]